MNLFFTSRLLIDDQSGLQKPMIDYEILANSQQYLQSRVVGRTIWQFGSIESVSLPKKYLWPRTWAMWFYIYLQMSFDKAQKKKKKRKH